MPESWIITTIKNIGDIQTGNTPSKKIIEYYNGIFPFFKPTDLSQGKYLTYPSETLSEKGYLKARRLPKGSVLINSIGNIGTVALLQVEGAFNQKINGIKPYSFIDGEFLFWLLQATYIQAQMIEKSSTTTISILNKSKFNEIEIAFPRKETQVKILEKINRTVEVLQKLY